MSGANIIPELLLQKTEKKLIKLKENLDILITDRNHKALMIEDLRRRIDTLVQSGNEDYSKRVELAKENEALKAQVAKLQRDKLSGEW